MKFAVLVLAFSFSCAAQTTDAIIAGKVYESTSRAAVEGVTVRIENAATGLTREDVTKSDGLYVLPLLPPGRYVLRITPPELYQRREVRSLDIPVAGLLTLDIPLRPLWDLWDRDQAGSIVDPATLRISRFTDRMWTSARLPRSNP